MLKSVFSNVFKNIYFVFVAMGIIYFALIICVISVVFGLANAASDISQDTYVQLRDYIVNYLNSMPISKVINSSAWSEFFAGLIDILAIEVNNLKGKTMAILLASAALLSLAFVFARFMCRYLMRRNKMDKNSRRGIAVVVFRFGISYFIALLSIYLQSIWRFSAFFLMMAFALLFSIESLICTWFVFFKGYKVKDIFNFSNCFKFIGCNFLTLIVGFAFITAIYYISNALIASLIAVPLLVYLVSAMDVNCLDYMRSKLTPIIEV